MIRSDYVIEVLPDRQAADAAARELVDAGLATPSLIDEIHRGASHAVDFDADRFFGRAVVIGILIGIPIGSLVIVGLVAVVAVATGSAASTGLIGAAAAGAFLGVLFGGVAGVAASNRVTEAVELIDEIPLPAGNVLVAARPATRASGQEQAIRAILDHHGAHPLTPDVHRAA